MEFNPYESPDAVIVAEAVWSEEERKLWQIALWQKYLMWFLLIFVACNALLFIQYIESDNQLRDRIFNATGVWITIIAFAISWCVVTLSLVKMELIRHNAVAATGVVIGMLIPVVNLFTLLGINGSATSYLRKFHVRVGLFGAEMGDIRRNLNKTVGEVDPDKVDESVLSLPSEPMVAQAIPVES